MLSFLVLSVICSGPGSPGVFLATKWSAEAQSLESSMCSNSLATKMQPDMKSKLIVRTTKDEDIELQWSMICVELHEKQDREILLHMMVDK